MMVRYSFCEILSHTELSTMLLFGLPLFMFIVLQRGAAVVPLGGHQRAAHVRYSTTSAVAADKRLQVSIFFLPSGAQLNKHKCTCGGLVKTLNQCFLHCTTNQLIIPFLSPCWKNLYACEERRTMESRVPLRALGSRELRPAFLDTNL